MRGALRVSGLRAGCSPVGAAPGWRDRQEGSPFLLANQNLLYLVLKCLMSTKHSGWGALGKRYLMHRRGVEKRQQKQPIAAPFAAYPRTFHRLFTGLSTGRPADERLRDVAVLRQTRGAGRAMRVRRLRLAGLRLRRANSTQAHLAPTSAHACRKLSANLSFLFNEVPFLERFGEAARAGFRAVEFAFAYDVPEARNRRAARPSTSSNAC